MITGEAHIHPGQIEAAVRAGQARGVMWQLVTGGVTAGALAYRMGNPQMATLGGSMILVGVVNAAYFPPPRLVFTVDNLAAAPRMAPRG